MNQVIKNKRKLLSKLDETIKSDKWQNLYVFKDGRTHKGTRIWPTEAAAKAYIDTTIELARLAGGWGHGNAITVPFDQWAYTLQLPIK